MTATERALLRIREEMAERKITQREMAGELRCSQSRVGKILTNQVKLRLEDIEVLAVAVGLKLTEVVRDRGVEFCAEMSPTELRLLERMRRHPGYLDGIMGLLEMAEAGQATATARRKLQRKRGRPLNSAKKETRV